MVVQNRNGGSMSHQERRIKAVGSNHCEKLESGGGGWAARKGGAGSGRFLGRRGRKGQKH